MVLEVNIHTLVLVATIPVADMVAVGLLECLLLVGQALIKADREIKVHIIEFQEHSQLLLHQTFRETVVQLSKVALFHIILLLTLNVLMFSAWLTACVTMVSTQWLISTRKMTHQRVGHPGLNKR